MKVGGRNLSEIIIVATVPSVLDANFWRHAVSYRQPDGDAVTSLFLRNSSSRHGALLGLVPGTLEPGILRCGLSLLLLRSIAPRVNYFRHLVLILFTIVKGIYLIVCGSVLISL